MSCSCFGFQDTFVPRLAHRLLPSRTFFSGTRDTMVSVARANTLAKLTRVTATETAALDTELATMATDPWVVEARGTIEALFSAMEAAEDVLHRMVMKLSGHARVGAAAAAATPGCDAGEWLSSGIQWHAVARHRPVRLGRLVTLPQSEPHPCGAAELGTCLDGVATRACGSARPSSGCGRGTDGTRACAAGASTGASAVKASATAAAGGSAWWRALHAGHASCQGSAATCLHARVIGWGATQAATAGLGADHCRRHAAHACSCGENDLPDARRGNPLRQSGGCHADPRGTQAVAAVGHHECHGIGTRWPAVLLRGRVSGGLEDGHG